MSESTVTWKQLCDEADPTPENKTEYEFSNGAKFERAREQ